FISLNCRKTFSGGLTMIRNKRRPILRSRLLLIQQFKRTRAGAASTPRGNTRGSISSKRAPSGRKHWCSRSGTKIHTISSPYAPLYDRAPPASPDLRTNTTSIGCADDGQNAEGAHNVKQPCA